VTYFIASGCIDVLDRSCIAECPVDCIYEGERKLYINPAECIDCGACEPVCPEEAIYSDRKPPDDVAGFCDDDRLFFEETLPGRPGPIGSPGGFDNLGGPAGADTLLVRSWPRTT